MEYCIRTKDHLLQLLNDCNTPDDLIGVCNNALLPLLIHGEGLWMECRYCYKAAELINRAVIECNCWLVTCLHYSKIKQLEDLRKRLCDVACRYVELHNELRETPVKVV